MVRAGYKQTEVGVVPEDWTATPLCENTLMMTNGFVGPARQHYTETDDGVLYIQGYNVLENAFNMHGIKYVSAAFHQDHQKSCLREGDLLTVQTGDVGLTTVVPPELAGSNCHALIITRLKQEKVNSKFVSYYLNSLPGRSRLKLIETGTTMKHLNVGDVLQFLVPLPPDRREQQAIAEALSDADGLIESLEQLIAKKRLIKQGAMQELLTGRRRLPGFKREWNKETFGTITSPRKERRAPTPLDQFIVELEHLGQKTGLLTGWAEDAPENSVKAVFRKDDVLFGKLRAYLCKYWMADKDGLCSTEVWPLVANSDVLIPAYLYQLVTTDTFIKEASLSFGTHMPRSDWNVVKNLTIELPPIEEQKEIALVLGNMDSELSALEQKLVKARQIKQGMMQELLTGRIRLI